MSYLMLLEFYTHKHKNGYVKQSINSREMGQIQLAIESDFYKKVFEKTALSFYYKIRENLGNLKSVRFTMDLSNIDAKFILRLEYSASDTSYLGCINADSLFNQKTSTLSATKFIKTLKVSY